MIKGRLHRRHRPDRREAEDDYFEVDPAELSGIFAVPSWLRDMGLMAWLLVGVALFIAGTVWLLALTQVIVVPVILAAVIAAVASPVVGWLHGHGVPRAAGAALLMVGFIAGGAGLALLMLTGIVSELGSADGHLEAGLDKVQGWVTDAGADGSSAAAAKDSVSSGASDAVATLLSGLGSAIGALSSLVFFLAMLALSMFFLLSDGPRIRAWGERHLGVPEPVARMVSSRTLGALRGYFLGVTIVAGFNAVVVTIGALILDVPLAGTIAMVTFFGAYVPYLGAWSAGAFAVLIALGGAGTDAAAGMIVVQLLANGILQQLVQPFAMGAALGIHPLAVLIVTIAGGALFGAVGLILAAPLVSAAVRISADLARARAEESAEREPPAAPASPAAPAPAPG
jgi:predicted PurR-regulated permease PerM